MQDADPAVVMHGIPDILTCMPETWAGSLDFDASCIAVLDEAGKEIVPTGSDGMAGLAGAAGRRDDDAVEYEAAVPEPRRRKKTKQQKLSRARKKQWMLTLLVELHACKVWRAVRVPGGIRLDALHQVLLAAMGWAADGLHAYTFSGGPGNKTYGPSASIEGVSHLSRDVEIHKLLPRLRDRLIWVYDPAGDRWVHSIQLTSKAKVSLAEASLEAGAGACPPEACGGIVGFNALQRVLAGTMRLEMVAPRVAQGLAAARGASDPESVRHLVPLWCQMPSLQAVRRAVQVSMRYTNPRAQAWDSEFMPLAKMQRQVHRVVSHGAEQEDVEDSSKEDSDYGDDTDDDDRTIIA